MDTTGDRIRRHRRERGMTIRALAGVLGVSTAVVSRHEHGHINPSQKSLERYAGVFGVSVRDLDARVDLRRRVERLEHAIAKARAILALVEHPVYAPDSEDDLIGLAEQALEVG